MNISLENSDTHAISSYTDDQVIINGVTYTKSLLLTASMIIPEWSVQSIHALTIEDFNPLLDASIDVILIGHQKLDEQIPFPVLQQLSKQRVGLECMSIGAACRTFNVLLSEHRMVALGVIFS